MTRPDIMVPRHDTTGTHNLIDTIMNEITNGEPDLDPKIMDLLHMQDTYARDLAAAPYGERESVLHLRETYESKFTPEQLQEADAARRRALGRLVRIEQQVRI